VNGIFKEIALKKDDQTYIFRFDDASHQALVGVLGRFAADPGLNFTWHAAAVLCKKARQECVKAAGVGPLASTTNRLR
jgi:hypothetical protein